jgi:lysophosphatidate acyltransferase
MAFTTILAYVFLGAPLAVFLTTQVLYVVASLTKNQYIDFYARCAASFTALIVCATYGTLASLALNIVGYGGLGQWTTARAFKWTMWLSTGVWFEIEDPEGLLEGDKWENLRPAVLLGNHQTELDVLVLGHLFPRYTSVTAKKSLMYVPILGWFSKFPVHHTSCTADLLLTQPSFPSGSQQNRLHRTQIPLASRRRFRQSR